MHSAYVRVCMYNLGIIQNSSTSIEILKTQYVHILINCLELDIRTEIQFV